MNGIKNITLSVRPSLAFPSRWSVDWWDDTNPEAAFQASLKTFDTAEKAYKSAEQIKVTLESRGSAVRLIQENKNISRELIPKPVDTEEDIITNLKEHIEKTLEPLANISIASFFDLANWDQVIKDMALKSPVSLSILVLIVLLFRGLLDKLLESIIPSVLGLNAAQIIAGAPLLVLISALYAYFYRSRISNQLDRAREWILQLTIFFGWDRNRFREIMLKELGHLEYASSMNQIKSFNKKDPTSLPRLLKTLDEKYVKLNDEDVNQLGIELLRDDFAKKIQALTGLGKQNGYNPKDLAISPNLLIMSNLSVNTILLGFLSGKPNGITLTQQFYDRMTIIGMLIGFLIDLIIIVPALVLTNIIAFNVSPFMFIVDLIASFLAVWLFANRPLRIIFGRQFIPQGLFLEECAGSF